MYKILIIIITLICFSCKIRKDNIETFYNSYFADDMSEAYSKKIGNYKDGFNSILEKGRSYVSLKDSIWILPPPFVSEDSFLDVFIKKDGKIKVQNIPYNLDKHGLYKIEIIDINQDGKKDFIIETTYWMSGDTTLYKKINSYLYENGQFSEQFFAD